MHKVAIILLWVFYAVTLAAFVHFSYSRYFNLFFEGFFIVIFMVSALKIKKKNLTLLTCTLVYFFVSMGYAVFLKHNNLLDFLLIYKFFFYASLLFFISGKTLFTGVAILRLYKFLLWIFLLKYLLAKFFFGNDRPILFHENNYELMFLTLVFYLSYLINKRVSYGEQFMLAIIFLLSGSKSAILILFFVLAVVNYKLLLKRIHVLLPGAMLFIVLGYEVIKQRMGGAFDLEKVDRFRFLMLFFKEVENWSFWDFLVGAERITALDPYVCQQLAYYQTLFSYSGDGTCYSVIFHSYLLRIIYDHGLIGLLFMLVILYTICKQSGLSSKSYLVILGIGMLNGLSVSSFNSIYFVVGLVFLLVTNKKINAVC